MGLTPLEGLMMGTRAGSIDPGILLRLLRVGDLTADALAEALDHDSGLLAVSRRSGEMRAVRDAADAGNADAALAIEMFARHAAEGIAAAATSLPRIDALVFTGGIGEHDGRTRGAIVARLAPLGWGTGDAAAIQALDGEGVAPGAGDALPLLVVTAREDLVIARATAERIASTT